MNSLGLAHWKSNCLRCEAEDETQLFANRRYRSTREKSFVTWHFLTWLYKFLRVSANLYVVRFQHKVSPESNESCLLTSTLHCDDICHTALMHRKIAVLWHFTIFDEFDVELLRRFHKKKHVTLSAFHTPTPPSWSSTKGLIRRWLWHVSKAKKKTHMYVTGMNL